MSSEHYGLPCCCCVLLLSWHAHWNSSYSAIVVLCQLQQIICKLRFTLVSGLTLILYCIVYRYNAVFTWTAFFCCLSASAGGALFGYDNGVMGGKCQAS